jgi:UDP-N-acetylmuramoyl-tripeptide--D-alanyl-D-alanine ligase
MVGTPDGEERFRLPFGELHNLQNALGAIAIGTALEVPLGEMAKRAPGITFSRLRGELIELPGEILLVNDCYNANPISMRAALEHLASLGADARQYHREVGAHARQLGVGPIIGVGELGRDYAPDAWAPDAATAIQLAESMIEPGDAVLVKGSRAVGLELVTDELVGRRRAGTA